jgi:hypothetical protein
MSKWWVIKVVNEDIEIAVKSNSSEEAIRKFEEQLQRKVLKASGPFHLVDLDDKQAARFAEMDNTSLDQFFLAAIAAKVGAKEAIDHVTKKLEERLTQIEFLILRGL